jgi:DNA-binding beta-propeller fold protein YncE
VDFLFHPVTTAKTAKTAFLIDSTRLAVSILSLSAAAWTLASTINLTGQTGGVPVALAISGDGATLFVLTTDSSGRCELVIYDLGGSPAGHLGTVTLLTTTPGSALTLRAAPDGSRAYVTDEASGQLLTVDRSGTSYALGGGPVQVGSFPIATALSPDGSRLYVVSKGTANCILGEVLTATLAVRSLVLPDRSTTGLTSLVVSPDGSRVLAADPVAAGVRIFDAASLRHLQTVSWNSLAEVPGGITVAPDGSRIFTANPGSGHLGVIAQVQGYTAGKAPRPS